jgi:threonine/homoserine/homoserine lactone efflux protein
MIATAFLAGFCLGFIGSVPIAGPTALVVVDSTLENRPRKGLCVAVGAAFAESIYAALAFWGLAHLFISYPMIVPASRLLGGGVLIIIGLHFALRHHRIQSAPRLEHINHDGRYLLFGFTITFFNPTLAVTWTAAIAAIHSVLPAHYTPIDALPFALGSCLGIVGWFWVLIRVICRFRMKVRLTPLSYVLRMTGGVLIIVGTVVTVRTLLGIY